MDSIPHGVSVCISVHLQRPHPLHRPGHPQQSSQRHLQEAAAQVGQEVFKGSVLPTLFPRHCFDKDMNNIQDLLYIWCQVIQLLKFVIMEEKNGAEATVRRQMKELDTVTTVQEQQFDQVVSIIVAHKREALSAVNEQMLLTAWSVGGYVSKKLKSEEWGSKVVTLLSEYIRSRHPELRGYSRRSLYNMVLFYDSCSSDSFLQTVEKYLGVDFVQTASAQMARSYFLMDIPCHSAFSMHEILAGISGLSKSEDGKLFNNESFKELLSKSCPSLRKV